MTFAMNAMSQCAGMKNTATRYAKSAEEQNDVDNRLHAADRRMAGYLLRRPEIHSRRYEKAYAVSPTSNSGLRHPQAGERMENTMTEAINLAHDLRRPFCWVIRSEGWWAIQGYNLDRLPNNIEEVKGDAVIYKD